MTKNIFYRFFEKPDEEEIKMIRKNRIAKRKKMLQKYLLLINFFWFDFSGISDQELLWLFTHKKKGRKKKESTQIQPKQTREICEKASIFLMPSVVTIIHIFFFFLLLAVFFLLVFSFFVLIYRKKAGSEVSGLFPRRFNFNKFNCEDFYWLWPVTVCLFRICDWNWK